MKASLQSRLIALLVIFSLVFIAIFTCIQVYNQLSRSTDFNYYRARTGALLLQLNLNNALKDIPPENTTQRNKTIQEVITGLYNLNIITQAMVVAKEGDLIFSIRKYSRLSIEDRQIIKEIFSSTAMSDKIYPVVDKKRRLINLYIPFSEGLLTKVEYDLGNISQALAEVYIPIVITVVLVIIANIFLAMLLSKILIGPIAALNNITSDIAAGNLNRRVDIKSGDELEELANTFNYMAVELKKMKAVAEDANPLTKLPGNIMIRNEVEGKIKNNKNFLVIHCDLDNFKAFNDKYGIEAGDRAIKLTADIFREAAAKKGNKNDFVGHEGGDDFLLLTTPEKGKDMADYIIAEFDRQVKAFYSKEDIELGYIEAKSRQGDVRRFPLMSVSLSGVTNQIRPITSYAEAANIAAEVKKKTKAMEGSCFLVDRRKAPWPPNVPRPT